MPRQRASKRAGIAGAVKLAALLLGAATGRAQAASPAFDEVFDTRGEPPSLHYRVDYRDAAGPHRLEVWRDAAGRLKRVTDDRVETYVVPRDNDVRLTVIDRRRQTSTVADRATLMRMGVFVDVFGQAHGVARPAGAYTLAATGRSEQVLGRICVVWRMTPAPGAAPSDICWDGAARLPLVIRDAQGAERWRVTALDEPPVAAAVFVPPQEGLVINDLNRELAPDAD